MNSPEWYIKKEMRSAMDLSFSDVRSMLWDSVRAAFGEKADLCSDGVFFSYIIFLWDGKYYRVNYAILDGAVKFGGEPAEVQKRWVEIRSAQGESEETAKDIRVTLDAAKDPEGMVWDVTVIAPGLSKHKPIPWFFPDEVLRADAAIFEGVDINLFDLPDKGATHVPDNIVDVKPYLVKKKAGWLDNVRHVVGEGIKGVIHFLDSYEWLGKNLLRAMQDGVFAYGLSLDCPVKAKMEEVDNKTVIKVSKFLKADSVDIVTRPAAGGKFNRAIAAQTQEENIMDKKGLWDLVMRMRADLLEGKEFEKIEEADLRAIADTMEPKKEPAKELAKKPAGDTSEVALLRCEMALDRVLTKADLPERVENRIRDSFKGRIFDEADLERAVADEKDYLADLEKSLKPEDPVEGSGIRVGIGTLQRAQMAIDKTFGLTKDDLMTLSKTKRLNNSNIFERRSTQDIGDYDDVPAFRGLLDMWAFFTGDPEVTWQFNRKKLHPDLRANMDITSSTFTYALGNTLHRRLVKMYQEINFREDVLISTKKPVKDFRTQEAVLIGGFPNIADVDPEAANYAEIEAVTDEEATYSVGQKGNLLSITRKTIKNDDISVIMRLVDAFAFAFRRTHAEYIWDFLVSNGTCSDGTAWFTSGHGNLGATALSHATAQAARLALAKMTEKDSGKRINMMMVPGTKPLLVYPPDLIATAEEIVGESYYYSSNDLTAKVHNPLYGKIEGLELTFLEDANDWAMIMPSRLVEIVEMGYMDGRELPEMFIADSPQSEQVFLADKIRYKGRHEYGGTIVDFRSGYKAVVT